MAGSSPRTLALAIAALTCWAVVLVAVLTSRPENGANIGAGMVGLLAIALTITAAVSWKR